MKVYVIKCYQRNDCASIFIRVLQITINISNFKLCFSIPEDSSVNIKLTKTPSKKEILVSPVFPPPPKYNSDKTSPFFETCKVSIEMKM